MTYITTGILVLMSTVNASHAGTIIVKYEGALVERIELRGVVRDYFNDCLIMIAIPEEINDPKIYGDGILSYSDELELINAIDENSCKIKK